jgi:metal-sulfur cluster biosynthetic enzyme
MALPAMTTSESLPSAVDPESLRSALRRVIDPEVDVNIVDLGLVYAIEFEADGEPDLVRIVMTMTSPACPMAEMIIADIDQVLDEVLPERWRVTVKIVWDPPWNPDMMADEARQHFGW